MPRITCLGGDPGAAGQHSCGHDRCKLARPLPRVQVLLPPSGGRLVLASDGVWSQAGEALLHAMRTAPIRTAALQVVQAAAASAHSDVDASAVVADVLEPGDTWQAVLRRRAEHEAAAEPGGAAPSRRGLGLLRKLSLGR